jgi:hypothetical protein
MMTSDFNGTEDFEGFFAHRGRRRRSQHLLEIIVGDVSCMRTREIWDKTVLQAIQMHLRTLLKCFVRLIHQQTISAICQPRGETRMEPMV